MNNTTYTYKLLYKKIIYESLTHTHMMASKLSHFLVLFVLLSFFSSFVSSIDESYKMFIVNGTAERAHAHCLLRGKDFGDFKLFDYVI